MQITSTFLRTSVHFNGLLPGRPSNLRSLVFTNQYVDKECKKLLNILLKGSETSLWPGLSVGRSVGWLVVGRLVGWSVVSS